MGNKKEVYFGQQSQTNQKDIIYTYEVNIKDNPNINQNKQITFTIEFFDEKGNSIIIKKQKECLFKNQLSEIVGKEEDRDSLITSIKFKNVDSNKVKDLLSLSKKENFIDYEESLLQNTMSNILSRIVRSGDYGLDSGLIYANIIINTLQNKYKPILNYKIKCQKDNDIYSYIECIRGIDTKIERYKQIYKERRFDESLSMDMIKDEIISQVKQEYEDGKIEPLFLSYCIPNFEIANHVTLVLTFQNIKQLFSINTQNARGNTNTNLHELIMDFNLQTLFGKGSCGFWISEMCIEFLKNIKEYDKMIINNTHSNPNYIINPDLLCKLILNTAVNVSNFIDTLLMIKIINLLKKVVLYKE